MSFARRGKYQFARLAYVGFFHFRAQAFGLSKQCERVQPWLFNRIRSGRDVIRVE